MYGDDTMMACKDTTLDGAITRINHALEDVATYLQVNKLKLNVKKSKAMIFATKHKYLVVSISAYVKINLSLSTA